ncbi:hypothetical protein L1049_016450 [Liquidambar formosana]|uniref:DUF3444 domain-containing protein n=1 Tax=Liquidambar formosana TaxID=63359 RepID=A0AAP0S6D8_LIQFO
MTGEERVGVPKGSFELDPASLPTNLEAVIDPEGLKVEAEDAYPNGSCSTSPADKVKPKMESEGSASAYQAGETETHFDPGNSNNVFKDHSAPQASPPEANELPEPEFYNFDAEKSAESFQVGQIWALYSDEDGLPKYYGQIKRIVSGPDIELHVAWLVACSRPDDIDKGMPICCGRFKLSRGKSQVYSGTASFSHKLRAEPAGKKNEYIIFPRKGEVWALYKNWNAGIKCSDLETCEYDIVEVLEENDLQIELLVLQRVDGFNSVFKGQVKGGSAVTMEISRVELLRFSHHIPAFRLTEERGGILRGFWELDSASVPVLIFCSN